MTILLVDDDPSVRELLSRVLQRAGYTVLGAGSGAEADAVLQAWDGPVDLLLCDVSMPGETGVALASRLAINRPTLRVMLMSGDPDAEGDLGAAELEVVFLAKPFSNAHLLARIRALIPA